MSIWIPAQHPYERLQIPAGRSIEDPGAYIFKREGKVIYVGMASSLRSRLGDHRRAGMLSGVTDGTLCPCATPEAAARLERALIWLLDPADNASRPTPTGPVWAATLTESRPVQGWSWFRECGHVSLGGRALAEESDIIAAGCACKAWSSWLVTVRAHIAGLEAELIKSGRLLHDQKEIAAIWQESAETIADMPRRCLECEDKDRTISWLQDEVGKLGSTLARVEWAP